MYELVIKPSAEKQMEQLPAKTRQRVVAALERLRLSPRPSNAAKLQGEEPLWRIRVGDYRVIYEIQDDRLLILVVRVAHRRDVYRNM